MSESDVRTMYEYTTEDGFYYATSQRAAEKYFTTQKPTGYRFFNPGMIQSQVYYDGQTYWDTEGDEIYRVARGVYKRIDEVQDLPEMPQTLASIFQLSNSNERSTE